MHHLLSREKTHGIGGINNVPGDIIELPSTLQEYWCFAPEVLEKISRHHETQQPLSQELINALMTSRNSFGGMILLCQVLFGLYDWLLHDSDEPNPMKTMAEHQSNI